MSPISVWSNISMTMAEMNDSEQQQQPRDDTGAEWCVGRFFGKDGAMVIVILCCELFHSNPF